MFASWPPPSTDAVLSSRDPMEGGGAATWVDTLFISLLEFEHVPPTDGLPVDECSFRFRPFKVVEDATLPSSQTVWAHCSSSISGTFATVLVARLTLDDIAELWHHEVQ